MFEIATRLVVCRAVSVATACGQPRNTFTGIIRDHADAVCVNRQARTPHVTTPDSLPRWH